jgi:hypothetical protein
VNSASQDNVISFAFKSSKSNISITFLDKESVDYFCRCFNKAVSCGYSCKGDIRQVWYLVITYQDGSIVKIMCYISRNEGDIEGLSLGYHPSAIDEINYYWVQLDEGRPPSVSAGLREVVERNDRR